MKHTPGPWHVIDGWNENGEGKYFPSVVLHGPDDDGALGRNRITINVSHDQEIPSLMANAHLIAASPELLKVLTLMVNNFEKYKSNGAENQALLRAKELINKLK